MTSRNWPNEFVRACATISLLLCWPLAAQTKAPAIALLDAGDAVQWQNWTREAGWQVIAPAGAPGADIDSRVRALAAAVESRDPERIGGPGAGVHRRPRRCQRGGVLRHLAHAGFVGRGRRARRFAQGGDRHQSHLRGEFHQRAGAVDLRRRQQAAGGEVDCRQAQPGMAAGVGRRQRGGAPPVAGEAQARRVPALDRLRDQLARVCALLLDPADEVRRQRAQ